MFFRAVDTLREFVDILCAGLAREEWINQRQPTPFPINLFPGDTLRYDGVSVETKRATVIRNETELVAYVRPYVLLRNMKG